MHDSCKDRSIWGLLLVVFSLFKFWKGTISDDFGSHSFFWLHNSHLYSKNKKVLFHIFSLIWFYCGFLFPYASLYPLLQVCGSYVFWGMGGDIKTEFIHLSGVVLPKYFILGTFDTWFLLHSCWLEAHSDDSIWSNLILSNFQCAVPFGQVCKHVWCNCGQVLESKCYPRHCCHRCRGCM